MRIYRPETGIRRNGGQDGKPPLRAWTYSMAREIRQGIPFEQAEQLRVVIRLSKKAFAATLGMDPRTLGRFKARGRLSTAASDRTYRLARLFEAAIELHDGDEARAERWLKTPNRALGYRRPIDAVAIQPDFERAMDLVEALREGVYV